MNNAIVKNYIYSCLYQILLIILPIVTAPYLTRVLGAESLGEYTYTNTVAYYFVVFSMLGLSNYGSRRIAMNSKNRDAGEVFHEVYSFQLAWASIISIMYVIFVLFFGRAEGRSLYLIQFFYVISAIFDVSWYFFGKEQFKVTVTRNVIVKLVATISIFLFIKSTNQLWLYALIIALSTLVGNLILFYLAIRESGFVFKSPLVFKEHIKEIVILFIPVLAVGIYTQVSKLILGNISSPADVTYYEYAYKIISAPLGFITALGTVMLPRMASLYSLGDFNSSQKLVSISFDYVAYLSVPLAVGLFAISSDFAVLFYGEDFGACGPVMGVLALTIPFIAWGNVARTQILIPSGRNRPFVLSVVIGALVNIPLNLTLIPTYGAFGASLATLVTEIIVCAYQLISIRRDVNFRQLAIGLRGTMLSAGVMGICIMLLIRCLGFGWMTIAIAFCGGIVVYFAISLMAKKDLRGTLKRILTKKGLPGA